ncbi:MAG TPA: ABC transporter substrate-binding protein [Myxococcota bacterium]|nr:ABC transporter substrate-binding protein [Myxococcota bacterium]
MTSINEGRRRVRALLGALTALVAVVSVAALASAAEPPRSVIQRTIDEVLAILRDKGRSSDQRRKDLEAIARDRFDFMTMSKLVMATNWKKLSPDQQTEFVDQFTRFLANDYGARIDRYHQEDVQITGEQPEARGDHTVKTKIVGGDNDGAIVDYRLRQQEGGGNWLIIDVVIEGISLVANYRDQFREVANQGGPVVVIQKLKEKNANPSAPVPELEPPKKSESPKKS